jgi:hypothetical protein
MTGEPGATGAQRPLADKGPHGLGVLGLWEQERDALLAWVGENLTLARRSAFGQRDLPRAFRTADLWLIHAADCCSRYSSWTCCGVRY